jgi:aminopeptidase N
VFVPEFNAGAMENVAAVTHSESYIFRDPPTENQRRTRAETLLHEMAHMWFGNLVTMRWWNDLWLNESFATYMSFLAMERNTRFDGVWEAFHSGMKVWAYRQDQLVTTHPIAATVADTDETFLNFDGITYGKGAAVIKQLVATIGLERFRDGMRRYFQRHAFGNATLAQFLEALEEGSGRDLKAWARLWLETPSLNTLAAAWESDGERLTSMTLTQTAPTEYPTPRPHHLEVGLATEDGNALKVESVHADIDAARADVPAARGMRRPVLVFPNHNDHTFAKIALDPASLDYVRGNLDRIDDPLLRQLLWTSLWHMVRDQQLRSTDYLTLVAQKVGVESDLELVESILGLAMAALGRFVPDEKREAAYHSFFQTAWDALRAAPSGDAHIIWARALIGVAVVPEDLDLIQRLADGKESVPGLTLDQDMRWSIAIKAVAYAMPGGEERVAAERARDESDRGQRAVLRAQTSRPTAAAKSEAWQRFHGEGYGSLHLTAAAMSGFHWTVQRDLLDPYAERFFERVPGVFEERLKEFASAYFGQLFPSFRVDQKLLDRSERLLAEVDGRNALLERMLRESNDDLARAIKCRAYDLTP